jgi:hypothetical protein
MNTTPRLRTTTGFRLRLLQIALIALFFITIANFSLIFQGDAAPAAGTGYESDNETLSKSYRGYIADAAFSENGKFIAARLINGTIVLFTRDGNPVFSKRPAGDALEGRIIVDPQGHFVIVDGPGHLWYINETRVFSLLEGEEILQSAGTVLVNRTLFTAGSRETMFRLDLFNGNTSRLSLSSPTGNLLGSNEYVIVTEGEGNTTTYYSVLNGHGALILQGTVASGGTPVAFDGSRLALLTAKDRVDVFNLTANSSSVIQADGTITGLSLKSGDPGVITLVSSDTGDRVSWYPVPEGYQNESFFPGKGTVAAVFLDEHSVAVLERNGNLTHLSLPGLIPSEARGLPGIEIYQDIPVTDTTVPHLVPGLIIGIIFAAIGGSIIFVYYRRRSQPVITIDVPEDITEMVDKGILSFKVSVQGSFHVLHGAVILDNRPIYEFDSVGDKTIPIEDLSSGRHTLIISCTATGRSGKIASKEVRRKCEITGRTESGYADIRICIEPLVFIEGEEVPMSCTITNTSPDVLVLNGTPMKPGQSYIVNYPVDTSLVGPAKTSIVIEYRTEKGALHQFREDVDYDVIPDHIS